MLIKKLKVKFPNSYEFALDADMELLISEWSHALGGFSGSELKNGLDACNDILEAPNLGQFKKLCRPRKINQNFNAYKYVPLKSLKQLDVNSIAAKAEKRLINLINGHELDDYDSDTEDKIDAYYKTRAKFPGEHSTVTGFLATYRSIKNYQLE